MKLRKPRIIRHSGDAIIRQKVRFFLAQLRENS
jgi:hypothetical protein